MPRDGDTLLKFPCRFPIKAMGRAGIGFDDLVIEIVRRHAADLDETQVTIRESRAGNWIAVTLVIEATSKAQLDAIYSDLSAHEHVVWAL